jgi:phage gp46-like protein
MLPLELTIDGQPANPGDVVEPLVRAVIVSLFTWRRAKPNDDLPADQRYGWWGDTYPSKAGDEIGSRLWLLSRAKLLNDTPVTAARYADEALEWLTVDRVAVDVQVAAERFGVDGLALRVTIIRGDQSRLDIRFVNFWDYIHAL